MEAGPFSSPRARKGWLVFAGVYLLVAGAMNAVWGLAAIQLAAGGLVLAHRIVGRALAVVIALAGLFVNFLSVGAYPLWSILALVANGLVLWAVTVYGEAFE